METYCWQTKEMEHLLKVLEAMLDEEGPISLHHKNTIMKQRILIRKLHNFRGDRLKWSRIASRVIGEK